MGYRGKLAEREKARLLRAQGLPLAVIATRLEVAKSSVSLWVRDVDFVPGAGSTAAVAAPRTRWSAASRLRSTACSRRAGPASAACRNGSS